MFNPELIRKLVNSVHVSREMYHHLRSRGLLRSYGNQLKMNQTNFIRFFRSNETPLQVKEYLVVSYLSSLNARKMSAEIMNSHDNPIPLMVTINNKKLAFMNPLTNRVVKPVDPTFAPLDYLSGTSAVIASKIFSDAISMKIAPYMMQVLKTLSYLLTLVRAIARWIMAQIFVNYEEDKEKIGDDARIIKGLTVDADYAGYVNDALNSINRMNIVLEKVVEPTIRVLCHELYFYFNDLLYHLNWWTSDWTQPNSYFPMTIEEHLAHDILDITRTLERRIEEMMSEIMKLDYSKLDVSHFRKNAVLKSPIPEFATRFFKSADVNQVRFVKHKLYDEAKRNMI